MPAFTVSSITICAGGSGVLTASNPSSYTWLPVTGLSSTSGSSVTANPSLSITYTVTETVASGCLNTATASVTVIPLPLITISNTPTACIGNTGTATAVVPNGNSSYTYNWLPIGGTSSVAVNLPAGTYSVTVADLNGCTSSSSTTIRSASNPIASLPPNVTILQGQSTILTTGGGITYQWIDGLTCTCVNPTVSPTATTTYCVVAIDINGCKDTACTTVSIEIPCPNPDLLSAPNAFSPNNDGTNDDFCLQGWGNCVEKFKVLIYDRWGVLVYQSENPDFCWNGRYNGNELDAQVFIYFIKAKYSNQTNIFTKKGNISLIR